MKSRRTLQPRSGVALLALTAVVVLSLSLAAIPQAVAAQGEHTISTSRTGTPPGLETGVRQGSESEALPGYSLFEINGVKVYFRKPPNEKEAHSAQIGAIMMAGTGNQKPDEAHCAHMAEHMVLMYPGPSGRSVWSIAAKDYVLGYPFPLNGHTGLDYTTYVISVAHSDTLDALSALLGSMFRSVLQSDEAFRTEIKRSRRELEVMTGNALSGLANKMRVTIFEGTRYHEALFKTPLTEVTAEKIRGFIEREYTPARLTLAIQADVDEQELISHISECLDGIDPGMGPADHSDVYLDPPSEAVVELRADKQYAGLVVGIPGVLPEDKQAVQALINIVTRRLWAVPQASRTRFVRELHLVMEGQDALIATYGYSDDAAQDIGLQVRRYANELTSILASLASDGPHLGELSYFVIPGTPRAQTIVTPYDAASEAVITLLSDGALETSIWDRAEALPENTLRVLKEAASKYLSNAKVSVVYVKEPSDSGIGLLLGAAALVASAVAGFLIWRKMTG